MARIIEIEDTITVGTLAEKLSLPVTKVITELMKNGVMATVNERIDIDTAQIIIGELGLADDIELKTRDVSEATVPTKKKTVSSHAITRPPVVAVMGHVDHGKTTLLDAMRGSHVARGEAGGITQHISAYQITHNDRLITFLDTPGHEAFSAIREHGAQLTDLVILVVAADDGVKPQTVEAIRYARKAGVRIIVAINKIDKDGADVNRVKQELSEQNLLVEEWGGDTIVQEVSAKEKRGITELLDMILLVADVEDLRADVDVPAEGLVIESRIEKGLGPVAHVLVQAGVVRKGDYIVVGSSYGKIRNLETTDGRNIAEAKPSTPVIISGLKVLPEFGDTLTVVESEKLARQHAEASQQDRARSSSRLTMGSSELLRMISKSDRVSELNIILKADVNGSLTTVTDSLKALENDEVAVRIVGSGVGNIGENDVQLATTSGAIIYGFNVNLAASVRNLANRDKVAVRLYKVIYELIDDVKEELSALLAPEIKETTLGELKVKAIFKTTKSDLICGGEVIKGKLSTPSLARVRRGKEQLAEVEVVNLKRGPQDVKEVVEGDLCGLSLRTSSRLELQPDDTVEVFTRQSIDRSI